MKGPTPIWLLNQKFLAPLFLCYDEKLRRNEEFIGKLQVHSPLILFLIISFI